MKARAEPRHFTSDSVRETPHSSLAVLSFRKGCFPKAESPAQAGPISVLSLHRHVLIPRLKTTYPAVEKFPDSSLEETSLRDETKVQTWKHEVNGMILGGLPQFYEWAA